MNPATEILLSTAFALTPEENWTQGAFARGARAIVVTGDRAARCWCMEGAIRESSMVLGFGYGRALRALNIVVRPRYFDAVSFNDAPSRTHAEVLDAIYRAAEIAEGM